MERELILTGLLIATAAFLIAAYATKLPYPIWLVVGGAAIGLLPPIPNAGLKPELVLVLLLPPLLYSAAYFSSVRDLRADARAISWLAVGLVLFTTAALALIGHHVAGLPWEVAFVLGAVLSPTDPVAATAIGRRVGAPPRILTIVEGESLLNDATALVAYKFAVAAAVTGTFSLVDAAGEFVVDVTAGIAAGLAVGWIMLQIARRMDDAPTEIALSILTPYFAYLPCEALGVSAVLAAVSAGLLCGWNAPRVLTPSTRIQAYSVWEVLVFGVNATLFLLLGLELQEVLDGVAGRPLATVAVDTAAVVGGVIVLRFLWVFWIVGLLRALPARRSGRRTAPGWDAATLVSWNGMRGAVSLATALAIPLTVADGAPFPQRDMLIFLVYATIIATVLGQGLTLPALIRRLGLAGVGAEREAAAEAQARLAAVDAALDRIEELRDEPWTVPELLDRMHRMLDLRRRTLVRRLHPEAPVDELPAHERGDAYARLHRELQDAQRERILELRNEGRVNDEIMRRIERDLDLEDARLEHDARLEADPRLER